MSFSCHVFTAGPPSPSLPTGSPKVVLDGPESEAIDFTQFSWGRWEVQQLPPESKLGVLDARRQELLAEDLEGNQQLELEWRAIVDAMSSAFNEKVYAENCELPVVLIEHVRFYPLVGWSSKLLPSDPDAWCFKVSLQRHWAGQFKSG